MAKKKQQQRKQQQRKQQNKPKQSAQKLLKSFGSKISKKEVKKFEQRLPTTPLKRVVKYDKKKKDVRLNPAARKYISGKGVNVPGFIPPDNGGDTRPVDDGSGIFGIIADHEKNIAGIYTEADKYIADAQTGAERYGYELGLEGTKYSADKESEWRQAVAGIEVKGRLDLQPIINAGLEKVSNIEAQASRDVADITGKYGVEGIKTRGEFDEKIGKINLAGSMYGLISSAFG